MSYSNPIYTTYTFASHGFGAGAGTNSIRAPKGATVGRLIDVGITSVTVVFNAVTTKAMVRVGTGSDADKYAQLEIVTGIDTGDSYNTRGDTDAIIESTILVSDLTSGQLEVSYVANTGGTPTGIAVPYIVVAWS